MLTLESNSYFPFLRKANLICPGVKAMPRCTRQLLLYPDFKIINIYGALALEAEAEAGAEAEAEAEAGAEAGAEAEAEAEAEAGAGAGAGDDHHIWSSYMIIIYDHHIR